LAAKFCIQQITVTSEAAKKTVIDDMLILHNVTIGDHLQCIGNKAGTETESALQMILASTNMHCTIRWGP
jgi:hypothetical protein